MKKFKHGCDKCSDDSSAHDVTLIGNYHAKLCNSCLNLWIVESRDEILKLSAIDCLIHAAIYANDSSKIKTLCDDKHFSHRFLYTLASTFVLAIIPPPPQESVP